MMVGDNPNTNFDGVVVPALVRELAGGRPVEMVWRNEIGGVTYRIGDGAEYVKHGPPHWEFDADPEFERLRWVSAFVAAPRPIDHGVDGTGNRWLRTEGIRVLGEATASSSHSTGQRWVYFLSPWGMQFELVSFPHGKRYESEQPPVRLWDPRSPSA